MTVLLREEVYLRPRLGEGFLGGNQVFASVRRRYFSCSRLWGLWGLYLLSAVLEPVRTESLLNEAHLCPHLSEDISWDDRGLALTRRLRCHLVLCLHDSTCPWSCARVACEDYYP